MMQGSLLHECFNITIEDQVVYSTSLHQSFQIEIFFPTRLARLGTIPHLEAPQDVG
jgi:hypothetical protein